jgi:xanthosine utilization system XapX-like protein
MLPSAGFVVGLPFDLEVPARRGSSYKVTLALVRMVTVVTGEQLMQVAPQLIEEKKGVNPRIDEYGQVVSTTETWFNGHKVKDVVVSDKHHPDAPELLAEYAYRTFVYPALPSLSITEGTIVPEVKEVLVGIHPRTQEQMLVYGFYQKEYWYEQLTSKWSRDKTEAMRINAETKNQVESNVKAQAETEAAEEAIRLATEREAEAQKPEPVLVCVQAAPKAVQTVWGVSESSLNALFAKFAK